MYDDHGNTRTAATELLLGTTTGGMIEIGNDLDYFRVDLVAGQRYLFEIQPSVTNPLNYNRMILQSASGLQLLEDSGYQNKAYVYTPASSGSYYLQVDGNESNYSRNDLCSADPKPPRLA